MTDAFDRLSSNFSIRESGSKGRSASFTIRKASSKDGHSSFLPRRDASDNLSSSLYTQGVETLSSSFWITTAQFKVERISNTITQMSYTPPSIATDVSYATILEVETKGYKEFTAIIAAGTPNDITYRIQGAVSQLPTVWAGITSQVDVDVTASDPENMGTAAVFTGTFDRIRIQVKYKSSAGRAWASLKAST
jgi:hypothetical protein